MSSWITKTVIGVLVVGLISCATTAHTSYTTRWNRVDPIVQHVSSRYEVDPMLIHAVIRQESNYQIYAVSHKGAQGLMQLMPGTARELGVTNAFSPQQNIDGGTRYLVQQLKRFGSVKRALQAYHAGPNAVASGRIPQSSRKYADKVLGRYYRLKGCSDYSTACIQQSAYIKTAELQQIVLGAKE